MSKQNYYRYFTLLMWFITSELISAQESWKLERDKDGIKIYSGIVEGSDLKSFKAQMLVNASIHTFVAVLQDIENMPEWGYKMKHTELLEKAGDTIQIYYADVTSPFPFENRDGIYLNKFRWESAENHLFVKIELLPDYLGKKDNMVRLKGNGYWSVKVLKNEMLDITFSMEIDPGGNIPAWLVNLMVDTTPFSTMTELRRIMGDKKYQGRNFGFINK